MSIFYQEADLGDPGHAEAIVELIDEYARGIGGQSAPLTSEAREGLVPGLSEHPNAMVFLACDDAEVVGVAVCVWGFSTFAGKPLLNIHDLTVRESHRGRGIGTGMLRAIADRAHSRGCCKVTLEVNDENEGAKRLYEKEGFGPWSPPTWFVSKRLD